MADPQSVFPRFFATLGAPPLRGREFDSRDTTTSPKVVLVNETFAREFLGGADPVGRGIGLHSTQQADATIVGLVRNMHHDGVRRNPVPVVYLPATQDDPGFARMFVVKSALPPSELGSTVRHLAAELSPDAALTHVQTLGERVDGSILRDRLLAGLSVTLGVLALSLAAIGLYGLMAYVVARRTPEIGVRVALGALPSRIWWNVLAEGLRIVALGIAIGLPAAVVAVRLARGLLFGIRPTDPVSNIVAVTVLVAIGSLATGIPARRAAAIDPVQALRTE